MDENVRRAVIKVVNMSGFSFNDSANKSEVMPGVKRRLKSGHKPSLRGIEKGKQLRQRLSREGLLLAFRQFAQILENQA